MAPSSSPIAVRSRHLVTPAGVRDASLIFQPDTGEILEIRPARKPLPHRTKLIDYGALWIIPALVDPHVHMNEPGRTAWEGAATATRAALAGGVTTVIDMPLNCSPVTTTAAALRKKIASVERSAYCNVGFWGGIVEGNGAEAPAIAAAGALGFKAFLCHSGLDEFPAARRKDLETAAAALADPEIPFLMHAEIVPAGARKLASTRRHADWLASRPESYERNAIQLVIDFCRHTRQHSHIVHLAAASAVPDLRTARAAGLPITVETCPHYLTFDAESVPDGATAYKCAPPIRSAENREALWEALRDGTIDMVATDHSPCPPSMKGLDTGDFGNSWGGIASLQLGLAATWTGASRRGFSLPDVVRWMSSAPARISTLDAFCGALTPELAADFVVFDPDAAFVVDPRRLEHRHPVTPYSGMALRGVVMETWSSGALVWSRERGFATRQSGIIYGNTHYADPALLQEIRATRHAAPAPAPRKRTRKHA